MPYRQTTWNIAKLLGISSNRIAYRQTALRFFQTAVHSLKSPCILSNGDALLLNCLCHPQTACAARKLFVSLAKRYVPLANRVCHSQNGVCRSQTARALRKPFAKTCKTACALRKPLVRCFMPFKSIFRRGENAENNQ